IEEGETVTVGQVIARLALGEERASDGGAAPEAPAAPAEETPAASAAPEPQPSAPTAQPPPAPAQPAGGPAAAASQGASATAAAPEAPAAAPEAPAAAARVEPMRGGGAALARYMEESRSIPTATSFRTLTVTMLDARRRQLKQAGRGVSFTHLIAYALARAAGEMAGMTNHFAEIDGKPNRVSDGQGNLGVAADV